MMSVGMGRAGGERLRDRDRQTDKQPHYLIIKKRSMGGENTIISGPGLNETGID